MMLAVINSQTKDIVRKLEGKLERLTTAMSSAMVSSNSNALHPATNAAGTAPPTTNIVSVLPPATKAAGATAPQGYSCLAEGVGTTAYLHFVDKNGNALPIVGGKELLNAVNNVAKEKDFLHVMSMVIEYKTDPNGRVQPYGAYVVFLPPSPPLPSRLPAPSPFSPPPKTRQY